MRLRLAAAAALAVAACGPVQESATDAGEGEGGSETGGGRDASAVLQAPPEAVWWALATAEGLAAWTGEGAEVEARRDGRIEPGDGAPGSGLLRGTLLVALPPEVLAVRTGSGRWSVWTLDRVAGAGGAPATRVRVTAHGSGGEGEGGRGGADAPAADALLASLADFVGSGRARRASVVRADSAFTHRSVRGWAARGAEPRLEWELVVPAPVDEVWRAWTTPDGIASWSAPAGAVELSLDGTWEAHFQPDRPPGQRGADANRILAFREGRLLAIAAGAPVRFPTVREEKTTFVLRLDPVGRGHTLVRGVQVGWRDGAEWKDAFDYLAGANAVWLDWLHQRFTTGPIDWTEGPAS